MMFELFLMKKQFPSTALVCVIGPTTTEDALTTAKKLLGHDWFLLFPKSVEKA